ncbi:ADP-ribosyltransferase [Mycobacterium sp. C31M]
MLEATGLNYQHSDQASTAGGSGPTGAVSGEQAETKAGDAPYAPVMSLVPPPPNWWLIQPLLNMIPLFGVAMTWPTGDSGMMNVTAAQWTNIGRGLKVFEPALQAASMAAGAQDIPEVGQITQALKDIGEGATKLAAVADGIGTAITDFARGVQETQDSIRRLLDRLSFGGLVDTVTGFFTGEGMDILREIANDVGNVLENFQNQVQGVLGLLDELATLLGEAADAFNKWARPILVATFGDDAGNLIADGLELYTDFEVGLGAAVIGLVSGTVALADPATWKGLADTAVMIAKDPTKIDDVLLQAGGEFIAWDELTGENPARGVGEAFGNIGSLFIPGGAFAKGGSVAKGLNFTRNLLEKGDLGPLARLPGLGGHRTPDMPELPDAPGVPHVPEFTPPAGIPGSVLNPSGAGPGSPSAPGSPNGNAPVRPQGGDPGGPSPTSPSPNGSPDVGAGPGSPSSGGPAPTGGSPSPGGGDGPSSNGPVPTGGSPGPSGGDAPSGGSQSSPSISSPSESPGPSGPSKPGGDDGPGPSSSGDKSANDWTSAGSGAGSGNGDSGNEISQKSDEVSGETPTGHGGIDDGGRLSTPNETDPTSQPGDQVSDPVDSQSGDHGHNPPHTGLSDPPANHGEVGGQLPDLTAINDEFRLDSGAVDPDRFDEWTQQVADAYPNISSEGVAGVYDYTTENYQGMNPYLRDVDPLSPEQQSILGSDSIANMTDDQRASWEQRIVNTDEGLASLPPYRADPTDLMSTTWRGLHASDDLLAQLQQGDIFRDSAYLSTSTDSRVAEQFALTADPGRTPTLLSIEGHNGVDVAPLSRYADEAEILFPRGSEFEVISRELGEDGVMRIFLRQVQP